MSEEKRIYTVATAHLDTIWNWDFETTVSKYIYNTLVDNFKLFEKYPDYTFSFEGSYRYELMEEYYPELFEKLKEYIKQGRWNVCGSAFENGDVNTPSPEALFRNILFGNSYFDKKFGKRSVDIYLPDCFGFGWALPSIAHHANLMGFTTQKLAWGSAYGVPFDIGKWYGVDGNYIYASVNPHDYYFTLKKLRDWDFVQNKMKENEKYNLPWTYIFHGIGDRGGAPAEESVKFVHDEIEKNESSNCKVLSSSADRIYHDIENELTQEQRDKLPEWKNELVMRDHAVGGYTSRSIGKRWNRRCEELADFAERTCVVSDWLNTKAYPQKELTRHWKRFIAHQFHDDLPGTSIQRAYKRTWNDYAVSMNGFSNIIDAAGSSIFPLMKSDFCTGIPVMVSNPVECDRHGIVTVILKEKEDEFFRVFDEKGREVVSQSSRINDNEIQLLFACDVKSLGYRVYDVRKSDRPCCIKGSLRIDDSILENQKYIVTINKKGNITSIIDKTQNERELLREPVSLGMYNYNGSKPWPAWELNYGDCNKEADRIPNLVTVTAEETGPARVAFRVVQKDKKSEFTNIIALSDGGECVEVYSEFEWRNLKTLAKQKFSFTASDKQATFDLGLGAIKRENMNDILFEVPAQKWADITDSSKEFGVSVISECKYGWDKRNDNTLRMTVIHTPKRDFRIDSMQSLMDLGLNRYSFAVFSHTGEVGAETQLEARKFIQPMAAFVGRKRSSGVLSSSFSFGEISTNNVVIRAIKKAENSSEIVVRLNEGVNKEQKGVSLKLGNGIIKARELYASEEEIGEAVVENGRLVADFKPYEIKTFALTLAPSEVQPNNQRCADVDLPFDTNAITENKNTSVSDIDESLPREIVPAVISAGKAEFRISPNDKNALLCKGQKIKISPDASRIYLLCASLSGDKSVLFTVGNQTRRVKIYDINERFAAWDLYGLKETAYIKEGRLAFDVTHSHNEKGDIFAKEKFLYIAEIENDNKADEITFPNDESIIVFSASACENAAECSLATYMYDRVNKRDYTYSLGIKARIGYAISNSEEKKHGHN